MLGSVPGCMNSGDKKILRIGYVYGPSELLHTAAQQIAAQINEESGGAIEVRLYPSGQLGNERELLEALRLGAIDMFIGGLAMAGWYIPEYGMVEAPFLWRDYDHINLVWGSSLGGEIRQTMFDRSGLTLHQPWFRGPRYLTTTSKIIKHPDDLVGLKLRVPELEVYIKSWQTFGANVTPLPFTDMFMALKLGVVEGQENPLATIYGNSLHEVQKYVMQTKHLIGFYLPVTGPFLAKRFTADEQVLIMNALDAATLFHNDTVERSEQEYKEKLEAAGVEFIAIDNEPFRKLAREKIPAKFSDTWKEGMYQAISEAR
jgi:tripartite ATP-independent transporter DctP family solute receptor